MADHIKALRLFDLAKDTEPTEDEKDHLRQCEECWTCRAIFLRMLNRHERDKSNPDSAA
jgi:hypothetical protein